MKIAIISDTHFGYARFEEDSFTQAERAFLDADNKSDVIIYAGDIFDIKIPKLETIQRAISILKKIKKPIYAIHGNHERRSFDMTNPVQLLFTMGLLRYLNCNDEIFEKSNEKIQIFGFSNVPEEMAEATLSKSMEKFQKHENAFRILVLHQSIKELIPNAKEELSLEYLKTLPFDLIINGHIHESVVKLDGKFLIPGSTVITQLKKGETNPRGYMLYDTVAKKHQFVDIECRRFFYEEINFKDASLEDVKNTVDQKIRLLRKEHEDAIIRVKVKGTLKEGVTSSDISFINEGYTYIDNELDSSNLKARLEKIKIHNSDKLSVRDIAIKELEEKVKDRIKIFSPRELFERLIVGTEETLEYLKEKQSQMQMSVKQ